MIKELYGRAFRSLVIVVCLYASKCKEAAELVPHGITLAASWLTKVAVLCSFGVSPAYPSPPTVAIEELSLTLVHHERSRRELALVRVREEVTQAFLLCVPSAFTFIVHLGTRAPVLALLNSRHSVSMSLSIRLTRRVLPMLVTLVPPLKLSLPVPLLLHRLI